MLSGEYLMSISFCLLWQSGSKSSMIRKHFSQLTNDDWCCCYCQRLLRQTGSSTSNLVKHLMKKHREEYKIIFAELSPRSVVIKKEQVEDDIEEDDDCHTNGNFKLCRIIDCIFNLQANWWLATFALRWLCQISF